MYKLTVYSTILYNHTINLTNQILNEFVTTHSTQKKMYMIDSQTCITSSETQFYVIPR